jgi:hypothetical protein
MNVDEGVVQQAAEVGFQIACLRASMQAGEKLLNSRRRDCGSRDRRQNRGVGGPAGHDFTAREKVGQPVVHAVIPIGQ